MASTTTAAAATTTATNTPLIAHKPLRGGANDAASRCGEGWGLDLFEEGAEFAEVAAAHLNVDFVEGRTQAAALCGVFNGG